MSSRTRLAAVAVGAALAMLGTSSMVGTSVAAGDVIFDTVHVVSPNGGATVTGSIAWWSKRQWTFKGKLTDSRCNSHDVFFRVFKNWRYAWDAHRSNPWWEGWAEVRQVRNSKGCGTSVEIYVDYKDPTYDNRDVDIVACDDGNINSCSSELWPGEWYGVYRNPHIY